MDGAAPIPQPIRIAVVVGSLAIGGAEMDIVRNLPLIDRRRFDVRVYVFDEPGALASRLAAAGVPVVLSRRALQAVERPRQPFRDGGIGRLIRQGSQLLAAAAPLRRYIVRHRIDVVHSFLPYAYIVAGAATATVPGCRLVMSRVSSNFYMARFPHYRQFETRLLHRRLDAAVCNAANIREELIAEGVPPGRIHLIPNGIDVGHFAGSDCARWQARQALGIDAGDLMLSCVANLHPYKGHDDLLAALAAIAGDLPPRWHLLCAGRDMDGNRARLETMARTLGIGSNVRFLGSVDDVAGLLAASDIHIHPSREDALPNSVLEAMSAGLPVVATDVGSIPQAVIDGSVGIVVPPATPASLAAAILKLAEDPRLRQSLGAAGRQRVVEHYSLERSVRCFEQLYQALR